MRSFNNPKNDSGVRNVFDLSQRHIFSAKAGQLIPVCCVDTVPGDKFEIDLVNIARTMPLNTAAFTRMKQHFDWVFVPYRSLWSRFNEFIAQRNDPRSALYGLNTMDNPNMNPVFTPNITLQALNRIAGQMGVIDDMHGFKKNAGAFRLLDMLGYGDFIHTDFSQVSTVSVNLWRLLAYQKACAQFYRDPVHNPLIDAFAFNVDDVQGTSVLNSAITSVRTDATIQSILELRYRPWKKDIITGSVPTMQFGSVSAVPLSQQMVGSSTIPEVGVSDEWNSYYSASNGGFYPSKLKGVAPDGTSPASLLGDVSAVNDGTNEQGNLVVNAQATYDTYAQIRTIHKHPNGVATIAAGTSLFDIIALRKAEAIQKWKERTLRAGFHTDKQFEAHYGVSADEDGRWCADFIGSYESYINIDEVLTTANNNPTQGGSDVNNSVGDIAGKGVGLTQGDKLHFETNQFGCLMCIYSCTPEADYSSYGLDQNNALIERFDYFTSEFENLGLQAIPQSIYNVFGAGATTQVIGYGPRYWNYKTALDKVHGEFNFMRDGVTPGSLYDWATPRRDLTASTALPTLGAYYVNPHVLDSIFAVAADDSQATDQLLVNAFCEVKAIRGMSVIGLPY